MKRFQLLLFGLLTAMVFCGSFATHAAEVTVTGSTLKATAQGTNYEYAPLPQVKLLVFRGGPVFPAELTSDGQGRFQFGLPAGVPFRTVFYLDENIVPQMENLAGEAGLSHNFHVALLTVQEYRRLEEVQRFPPLVKHLQGILDVIPEASRPAVVIRAMLARLR